MKQSDNGDNFLKKDRYLISSDSLKYAIKNLSRPRFLGSIHLNNEVNQNFKSVENLIGNNLDLKLTQSLKNTILNPLTKILIIMAIAFNLFWFLWIYLF
ncbi:hypothetical protein LCGC14_0783010 [marine sediment metagenome]|uniref:Uncharacterized protein n=1 Tax=marine sediment metagenome TaxID=412755 RepID=A0A0F9QES7_9ZZZZ